MALASFTTDTGKLVSFNIENIVKVSPYITPGQTLVECVGNITNVVALEYAKVVAQLQHSHC